MKRIVWIDGITKNKKDTTTYRTKSYWASLVICMESHYYISAPYQNTDQSQWTNDIPVYEYVVGKIPSII